jgi:hypothetical protein
MSHKYKRAILSAAVSTALRDRTGHAAAQQLEEVIVTATKRAESLQDVPIPILAMGGDAIQKQGISGRLAFRGYQMDGYMDNTITGDDNPERDDKTVRVKLRWDASDNLVADFKAEYSEFETKKGTTTQLSIINPLTDAAAQTSALNAVLAGGPEEFDDERAVINDGGAGLRDLVSPVRFGGPGFPDKEEASDLEFRRQHAHHPRCALHH